jgi:hypothetical protein
MMLMKKEQKKVQMKRVGEAVRRWLCASVSMYILIWMILFSALTQVKGQSSNTLKITSITPNDIKVGMYQVIENGGYYSVELKLTGSGFKSIGQIKFSFKNTTYGTTETPITWSKGDENWKIKVNIKDDNEMIIKPIVLSQKDNDGIFKWTLKLIGNNNQSAETSFTVRYIKHGIDKWLLDRIDELAETYYNKNWQIITINQYKAWIATITIEGADGGYAAHSRYINYK